MNAPFGIYRIIAPVLGLSDPAKRLVAVIVAYMDDAGTDEVAPAVTLLAYVSLLPSWQTFETIAGAVLHGFGVNDLQAKHFHNSRGDFEGWSRDRKFAFLGALFQPVHDHVGFGVSVSTLKTRYVERKKETGLGPTMSSFGFCFQALLNHVAADEPVANMLANRSDIDLSFVLETGNKNNQELFILFEHLKAKYPQLKLKSFSFADKNSTAALGVVDFLAFYIKRHATKRIQAGGAPVPLPKELEIILGDDKHYATIATDFHA